MAQPDIQSPTKAPTRERLDAALRLVLDNSRTTTEAAAHVGVSYNTFIRFKVPTFRIGKERRIWLADLDAMAK